VRTDRTIPNNKPGIIICGNKHGTCTLIDASIPGDRNVIKKEAEKILKQRTHNRNSMHVECETKVIPVIRGAIGTISISLIVYLSNITGKQEIKGL
jgi:hypothetical protein